MLISGSSGCGKTNLLLRMLLNDNFLDYDNLLLLRKNIISPEYEIILNMKINYQKNQ